MVDSLFAWQEWDGERWDTIAGVIPAIGTVSALVVRDFQTAAQLEPLARAHGRKSGNKVALRRFEYVEEV